MANDVSEGKAGSGVQLQHICDQIFELLGIESRFLVLLMLLPENIGFTFGNKSVVRILWICGVEWRVTGVQDKENDAKGKQINIVTLVDLLSDQLGGHVRSSSKDGSQKTRAVLALNIGSETEIRESDVKLLVKHNVFGLQITV